jgi:E1-E2 ATPase
VKKCHVWHAVSLQVCGFSGPEEVLRVVLRVVLGSEARVGKRMECDSSLHPPFSASYYPMKQRILLGLAPIFIICVGIGLYAIWLFSRLGGAVDVILRENYQCVLAGQAMKESAERMDSALSLALAGEEERGRNLFESYAAVFEEKLRHNRDSISLPGERGVADKINKAEERYQGLAKKFWNSSDLGTRRTLYFSQLLPLFTQIQNNLQEVIRISEDNMVQADHRARTLSANSTRTMFLVLVVGAGVALLLAPVIRESGSDRSAVTGGTKVLSDQIKVQITSNPGETFVDRMIDLVERVNRQKTPNEIALTILLSAMTLVFLVAVISLKAFGIASSLNLTIPVLVSLLVCLIPTTMGGLLSANGIAGIDRLVQKNVLARSGRAVEAAGDVDVLLLDKTGTVTIGNRQATDFLPVPGVTKLQLADAAQLASLADETPEGSIRSHSGQEVWHTRSAIK